MSIFIGGIEITDSTKIKVGATDVSEVYIGATKVWPPVPAILTGHLIPGATGFSFESDGEFEVTQSGTTTKYPGTGIRPVTGVNDASEIEIKLTNTTATSYFKFKDDMWLSLNLKEIGLIITLGSSFKRLGNLVHFSSDADLGKIENFSYAFEYCGKLENFPLINTSSAINLKYAWRYNLKFKNFPNIVTSKVTNFEGAWAECFILESFPEIDTTSGTNFRRTWDGCKILKCISGTLDFTNLTNGEWTFKRTPLLTAPAPTGTPIRAGDSGLAGTWNNPNPCPLPLPAPVADFSGTPVSGEMPLSVVFTDHSTNNPTSWAWDFGDGGTSTQQNPTHIYGTSGTWTVRLMATNSTGSDTVTKTDYITVNTVHAIITGHLIPGATGFSFESDGEFEVTQSGTSTKYPGTGIRAVTGVNDASVIEINLTNTIATSYFKLKNNVWLNLNLKNIGNIITLENSFFGLSKMATFECDANLSNVTNLLDAWNGCTLIKMFPLINTKSVTNIARAWRLNTGLSNFPKIDTSNVKIFSYAWMHCVGLIDFPELNYSNGISLEGTFGECNKIKAMPAINSTKGTNFRVMFKECTALECLTSIDTRQQTDTLEMFEGCTSLIAPNAAEQTIIKGGSIWTNSHPCPLPATDTAILTGHMFPTETGFSFESDGEFEVTQSGTTTKYTGTGTRSVTGVDGVSEIEIKLINTTDTSYFKFKTDSWNSVNLKKLGNITTLSECFPPLHKMINFECDADTSKVTNMYGAWSKCYAMKNFPLIDTSTCTSFYRTWYECKALTSFPNLDFSKGTVFKEAWWGSTYIKCFPKMDFSSLTLGEGAFWGCSVLIAPPVFGTPVRSRDNAAAGIWTNPNPCP